MPVDCCEPIVTRPEPDNEVCFRCKEPGFVLGCDYCENFYHILCLVSPLLAIPDKELIFPACFGDSVLEKKLYEGPDLRRAVRDALADCENSETIPAIARNTALLGRPL